MTKMVLVGLLIVVGALACERTRPPVGVSQVAMPAVASRRAKDVPRVSPRDVLIHLPGTERPTSYTLVDLTPDEERRCLRRRVTCQGELTSDDLTRTSTGWQVFAPRNCRPSFVTTGKLTHLWMVTRAGVTRIARHDCLGVNADDDYSYIAWRNCDDIRVVAQLTTL